MESGGRPGLLLIGGVSTPCNPPRRRKILAEDPERNLSQSLKGGGEGWNPTPSGAELLKGALGSRCEMMPEMTKNIAVALAGGTVPTRATHNALGSFALHLCSHQRFAQQQERGGGAATHPAHGPKPQPHGWMGGPKKKGVRGQRSTCFRSFGLALPGSRVQ